MKLILLCILLFHFVAFSQADSLHQDEPGKSDVCGPRVGYWKIYGRHLPKRGYPDTALIKEGAYDERGRKKGLWKYYNPDGNLKKTAFYLKNYLNGKLSKYYPEGGIMEEVEMSMGRMIGPRTVYFKDSCINKVIRYGPKEKPTLVQVFSKQNCNVLIEEFTPPFKRKNDSLLNGYVKVYGWEEPERGYPDSAIIREGEYLYGKKIRIWKFYDKKGKLEFSSKFVNDRTSGKFYLGYYDPESPEDSATLKIVCENIGQPISWDTLNFMDSERGKQGFWYINSAMKPEKNYPKHDIIEHGYYKDNRRQGVWFSYWVNGVIKTITEYKNSRPNGISVEYFPSGCLKKKTSYKYGRPIYEETYSDSICNVLIKADSIPRISKTLIGCGIKLDGNNDNNRDKVEIFDWNANLDLDELEFIDTMHFTTTKLNLKPEDLNESLTNQIKSFTSGIGGRFAFIDFENADRNSIRWTYTYYIYRKKKD